MVQGSKRVRTGSDVFNLGIGDSLLISAVVPRVSQITEAPDQEARLRSRDCQYPSAGCFNTTNRPCYQLSMALEANVLTKKYNLLYRLVDNKHLRPPINAPQAFGAPSVTHIQLQA